MSVAAVLGAAVTGAADVAGRVASAGLVLAESSKKGEFDPNQVTPGPVGFIFTALLAGGVLLLGFSLVRRLRRNQYRREVHEEIARELAEREAAGGAAAGAVAADEAASAADGVAPSAPKPGDAAEPGKDQ